MANFCVKCGNKLVDGQACACQTTANMGAYQQPTQQAFQSGNAAADMNTKMNINKEEAVQYMKGMFGTAKEVLMAPYTNGAKLLQRENIKEAFSFIGLQAIMTALFVLIVLFKADSFIKMLLSSNAGYSDYFAMKQLLKLPMFKGVILTILISLAGSCLLAGILFVVNKLFGNQVSYQKMLCAVSVRSIPMSVVTAVAALVLFVSVRYGFVLFLVADLLGVFYMLVAYCGDETFAGKNSTAVVVFISVVVFAIIMSILVKNVFPQYLPDKIRMVWKEFGTKFNKQGGLSGIYQELIEEAMY